MNETKPEQTIMSHDYRLAKRIFPTIELEYSYRKLQVHHDPERDTLAICNRNEIFEFYPGSEAEAQRVIDAMQKWIGRNDGK